MKVQLSLVLAVTLLAVGLSGCGGASSTSQKADMEAMYVANAKEAPVEASPEQAAVSVVKQIEENEGSCSASAVDSDEFEKLTGITGEEYLEVVAYESDAKEGLANIFIVKPYPSLREDVRSKLLNYRESKMREFENFDILDSYSIAKNAVVYDQGEYLIMLMVKDNNSAQAQVDMYIPQ